MTTTRFEVADGYYGSMTKQEWTLVRDCEERISLWGRSCRSALRGRSARDLVLTGIAVGGHRQLLEYRLQLLERVPPAPIATFRDVHRYVAQGRLRAYRVGPKLVRFDADEVKRALIGEER